MLKVLNQAKATKIKKTYVLVKPGQKLLFIWVGHFEKAPPACHQLFDQSLQSVLVFSFGCHDNGVVARLGWCQWHHFFAIILVDTQCTQYHISSELAVNIYQLPKYADLFTAACEIFRNRQVRSIINLKLKNGNGLIKAIPTTPPTYMVCVELCQNLYSGLENPDLSKGAMHK